MTWGAWIRTVARHGFRIHPCQWHTAALMPALGALHSTFALAERLLYGRKIADLPPLEPPVFVIGHWRTGTTWLHELLNLDPSHTAPTCYECFSPHDFLVSERILRFRWLIPSHRPMDNMEMGFDHPQEDEFALAVLGVPSPYHTIAFPNRRQHDDAYRDLEGLSEADRNAWKSQLLGFLRRVVFKRPGRLVLKSPTHSYRIKTLLELFPEARFVHIVRDPRVVFPSTIHLWKSLHQAQGLQVPTHEGLEERVFRDFLHLYEKVEESRRLVRPDRFFEVRYEDLKADPVGRMEALYRDLELGDFEPVRPLIEDYLGSRRTYRTNRYELTNELRDQVEARLATVIERFGYDQAAAAPARGPRGSAELAPTGRGR